jgi:hypothetical protein
MVTLTGLQNSPRASLYVNKESPSWNLIATQRADIGLLVYVAIRKQLHKTLLTHRGQILVNFVYVAIKNSLIKPYCRTEGVFQSYRVSQKSWRGFVRLYLGNPWDYRNGIDAKRCVSSLSFVGFVKNAKYQENIFALSHLSDSSGSKFARSYYASPWDYRRNGTGDKRWVWFWSFVRL